MFFLHTKLMVKIDQQRYQTDPAYRAECDDRIALGAALDTTLAKDLPNYQPGTRISHADAQTVIERLDRENAVLANELTGTCEDLAYVVATVVQNEPELREGGMELIRFLATISASTRVRE